MPARPTAITLEPEAQKRLAIELFNYVWTLVEQDGRTERETDRMIDAAHASRLFWESLGKPVNAARGEWQISRAYAIAGRPEPSLHHAQRCLQISDEHGIGGFDLAYAHEAMARALAMAGDSDGAAQHHGKARQVADTVADQEDRELLLSDLETLPR